MRVAQTGLTMAEYFRDVQHQDVLLFVDNIFRYLQAGSEVSALLGRMPSAVGYQPTLANEMGELEERITSTEKGSITYVRLFADTAVKAEEVDDYRARSASARAAERERQKLSIKQYINTNLSLKRAMGHKRH